MRKWCRRHAVRNGIATTLVLALPAFGLASPATEYGLFNTGVNNLQEVLTDNAIDPHYTMIEPSHVTGSPIVATSAGGFPIGPWLDDNHLSAWIAPAADTNGDGDTDGSPSFVFRTSFDLTGKPLAGLSISGKWSTDNAGLDILLNGNSLGLVNTAQFASYTDFTLDSGFISGVNKLDFVINNGATAVDPFGPTGLRVEFAGNGNAPPPPPPPHPYSIPTLYATGVDNNRVPLEGDIIPDPHYTIVSGPNGETLDTVTVPNDGFPIGPWFANNSKSRWISPPAIDGGNDANGDPGTYVYQTTFTMSGMDLDNAVIVGGRGTDNESTVVLVNGIEIPAAASRQFGERTWFAVSSASLKEAGTSFKEGENTIAFVVDNAGDTPNPTGFRLDNLFARAAPAGTVPIPGLFNTGVGDDKLPLGDDEAELHYKLQSAPEEAQDTVALSGPPSPPWVDNTGSSRWVGPSNTVAGEGPPGDYVYTIDFDLTGLDPKSAVIMGMWSADNIGGEILLNGVSTGNAQNGSFLNLSEFEISNSLGDNFLPGKNTLTFQYNNAGETFNPAGLRVEGLVAFAKSLQGLAGDFNGNGVLDAEDIDQLSTAARANGPVRFDLNSDGNVNDDDRQVWINDLRKTYVGDANLDGQFDSEDFVAIFVVGKYETGSAASWSEGDWDGDGQFTSGDFVTAFVAGGYELGPRAGVAAVPEPATNVLLYGAIVSLWHYRRRAR